MNRAAARGTSLTFGGATAALILFVIRVQFPELYAEMGDIEKQSITVLAVGAFQMGWSLFGPRTKQEKGGT